MCADNFRLSGAPRTPNDDQTSCPYCYGYGYIPRGQYWTHAESGSKAVRCGDCCGRGVLERPFWMKMSSE